MRRVAETSSAYLRLNGLRKRLDDLAREVNHWKIFPEHRPRDYSAFHALGYELLRLEQSEVSDSGIRVAKSVADYAKREAAKRQTTTPSIFTDLNRQFVLKLFFDEQQLEDATKVLSANKVPRADLDALARISEFLRERARKTRWEAWSYNIKQPMADQFRVPFDLVPSSASGFRNGLFFFRWCILGKLAFEASFGKSIETFRIMRQKIGEEARLARLPQTRTPEWGSEFLDKILPNVTVDKYTKFEQAKDLSDLNRLWALEFMHADYARLLSWGPLDKDKPHVLSDIVMNKIGAFLLYARFQRGWTWKEEGTWRSALTKRKVGFAFPDDCPREQPIEVDGKYHAFSYYEEVCPQHVKELGRKITLHDPQDFLEG